jgi:hypothetical protein
MLPIIGVIWDNQFFMHTVRLSTDDADYTDDQEKTYRGRIAELQARHLSNLTSKELIELNDDGCSLIRVGL